jgi:hypothetical protein
MSYLHILNPLWILVIYQLSSLWNDDFIILSIRFLLLCYYFYITTSYHAIPPITATDIGRQAFRILSGTFDEENWSDISNETKGVIVNEFNTVLIIIIYARNIIILCLYTLFVAMNIHLFYLFIYLSKYKIKSSFLFLGPFSAHFHYKYQ